MQIGDETDGLPAGLDAGAEAYVMDNSESKSMDPPVQIEPLVDHGSAGIYGHALQHGPGLDSVRDPRGDQDQALNESIQDQEISSSDPPATSCKKDLQETFSRFRSKSEGSRLGFPRKGLLKKNSDPDGIKLHRRVSFADSNGLELEEIRSFEQPTFDLEDQPEPDFLLPACTNSATTRSRVSGERRFVPYFTLPWSQPGKHSVVFAALEDRKVCLETLTINSSWRMSGTILVKNLSFDKHVFVRRTLDKWHTYNDLDASYVCSVNENVDRFRFELHFAFKLPPGTRLEIALGYNVGHGKGQYWDNNSDNNYAFWFNDKL